MAFWKLPHCPVTPLFYRLMRYLNFDVDCAAPGTRSRNMLDPPPINLSAPTSVFAGRSRVKIGPRRIQ